MSLIGFYFLAFLALFFALMVVLSKNPVYSVIFLILTFFSIFGHYVLLHAEFLAFVHLIVYAGAIMVLFLYTIMMLNLNRAAEPNKSVLSKVAAAVAAGSLLVTFVAAMRGTAMPVGAAKGLAQPSGFSLGSVQNLGQVLFHDFLLPFEVSSLLFLLAMVGAVMLGKKEERVPEPKPGFETV